MEGGFFIRYGGAVPGMEQKALEVYAQGMRFLQDLLSRGEISFFEAFGIATGEHAGDGFVLIKGPEPKLTEIIQGEEFRTLMIKVGYVTEHLEVEVLTVGEELAAQIERMSRVAPEFALAR